YHFGDGTSPISQADHFLATVASSHRPLRTADDPEKKRTGVLLVLDFVKKGHYPGGSMSVSEAVALVERIQERTVKVPGHVGNDAMLQALWQEHAWIPTV